MGYCVKCGQWVEDSAKFCQSCGEPNMNYYQGFNSVAPVSAEPVQEGVPVAKHGLNVMAIVAMGLCELGIPGMILALIALKRAKSGEYRVPLKPLAIPRLSQAYALSCSGSRISCSLGSSWEESSFTGSISITTFRISLLCFSISFNCGGVS